MTFPPSATSLPWLREECRVPEVDGDERSPSIMPCSAESLMCFVGGALWGQILAPWQARSRCPQLKGGLKEGKLVFRTVRAGHN